MEKKKCDILYQELFEAKDMVMFECLNRSGKEIIKNSDYVKMIENVSSNMSKILKSISDKPNFVGVRMSSTPNFYAIVFGILRIGMNVLLMDPKTDERQYKSLLEEADSNILITNMMNVEVNSKIYVINSDDLLTVCEEPYMLDWAEYIAFSTSGTTGKSRVILYHTSDFFKQAIYTIRYYREADFVKKLLQGEEINGKKFITILPMHHILGFIFPLILIGYGATFTFPQNGAISTVIKAILENHVWGCIGIPMFWQTLYNIIARKSGNFSRESIDTYLGKDFIFGLTGGTNMEPQLRDAYKKAGIYLTCGFGMTEVGCATLMVPDECDENSEGKLYSWYDAKIKEENGNIVSEGVGELLLKTPVMFTGYLSKGKILEREQCEGGYFPTGDIFRKKGDVIYFVGRLKNVIVNSSGENIYTEELEKHFESLKESKLTYGIISLGEEPCLLVEVDSHEATDAIKERIIKEAGMLSIYQRPSKIIFTKCKLPLTSKFELKKYALTDEILYHEENVEVILKNGGR